MAWASFAHFDIYGVGREEQEMIVDHLNHEIDQYLALTAFDPGVHDDDILFKRSELEQKLANVLKKVGSYSFVHLSTVYYSKENKNYTTLDIVSKKERQQRSPRGMHAKVSKQRRPEPKALKELFQRWVAYEERCGQLITKKVRSEAPRSCPVLYCSCGFTAEEEKEVLPFFTYGAHRYHKRLSEITKKNAPREKRINAIYLLAHDPNYKRTVKTLVPLIQDKNASVRNAAMRVLIRIAEQKKINDIPLNILIKTLDYPETADRSNAAYLLLAILEKNTAYAKPVAKKAGKTLLQLLALQQPNNHDPAYQILTLISNKNYADTELEQWRYWLAKQRKRV